MPGGPRRNTIQIATSGWASMPASAWSISTIQLAIQLNSSCMRQGSWGKTQGGADAISKFLTKKYLPKKSLYTWQGLWTCPEIAPKKEGSSDQVTASSPSQSLKQKYLTPPITFPHHTFHRDLSILCLWRSAGIKYRRWVRISDGCGSKMNFRAAVLLLCSLAIASAFSKTLALYRSPWALCDTSWSSFCIFVSGVRNLGNRVPW